MNDSSETDDTTDSQDLNQKMPALLSCLADSDNMEEYFSSWLEIISISIPSFIQGLIFISSEKGENSVVPVSMWPKEGNEPERIVEVTEKSLRDGCGLVVKLDDRETNGHQYFAICLPLMIDDKNVCTISLEVAVTLKDELKSIMEQLQWGVFCLEAFFRRNIMKSERQKISRMESALDMMAGLQSKKKWEEAAIDFVTALSVVLNCDRVSIGFVHGHRVKIKAISNSASISKKMNLVIAIEEAMHEAILMKQEIIFPVPEDEKKSYITRMHEILSEQCENSSILTLPFYHQGGYAGVLTLERSKNDPFSRETLKYCKGVEALVFPALMEKKANDRNIAIKIVHSFFNMAGMVLGTKYTGRKLFVILLILSGYFFSTMEGPYRLSANSVLECETKQIVAAPFNAYIQTSDVRPGDTVDKGDLICKLDDKDLKLELMGYISQKDQLEKQYQYEKAQHNQAEAKIIKSRIDQIDAQIEQVSNRIKRAKIVSPFKGIIVSGDLTRRLGGFVELGESIFEIAPLDQYRVILKVDEKRINDVKKGLIGSIVFFSMPKEKFELMVSKITPLSLAEEGVNYFRVEASLTRLSEKMRPGMEGIGKIEIRTEKYYRIWTRSLMEWTRMFIWKWLSG